MSPAKDSSSKCGSIIKSGSILKVVSKDEGSSWGKVLTAAQRKNPGPLLKEDGSTLLFYRADDMDLPIPTCSSYGVAMTQCPADDDTPCKPPNDEHVFDHT